MINFQDMPAHSKIWVYQSNRNFTKEEAGIISYNSAHFAESWSSHGSQLRASVNLFHNRFLVVCVDEEVAQASGCSIDKSVHFVKQMESEFHIEFFNRTLIAYRDEDAIVACNIHEVEGLINNGKISESTIMFNNLVSTKEEFQNRWEIPLRESWLYELAYS